MDKVNEFLTKFRTLFLNVTTFGMALVALLIVLYMLLGETSGEYTISVVTNVTLLIGALTPESVVIAGLGLFLLHVYQNRSK